MRALVQLFATYLESIWFGLNENWERPVYERRNSWPSVIVFSQTKPHGQDFHSRCIDPVWTTTRGPDPANIQDVDTHECTRCDSQGTEQGP